jgi:hypothetical protein
VFAARADLARAGAVFRAFGPSVSAAAVREASARMLLLGDALAYARANALRSSERETLARTAYTTARFERRRVELLRDRALAAFARAAERAETLQIDEGNAARHNSTALEEHIEAFVHHGSRTFGPSEPLADLAALSGQLNPTESEPVR